MAASTEVIHAAKVFTKHGRSAQVSVIKEIAAGMTLGLAAGFVWKMYHWNEKRKIEEYYYTLSKVQKIEASDE
ncbi:hypothetical protein WJX72_002535 [[Myrmecia] bisecta]|uniref:Cytochrome c oxidase subunit 5C n=1 Tax=[Myrmecia] bisecta TaxID=41462 RepID=A0AAW1QAC3_9CHLO